MSNPVKTELKNRVRHIVIDRADAKNALNSAVASGLTAAFNAAAREGECRVILLYGSGSEAFCAGGDLKEVSALGSMNQAEEFFGKIAELFDSIYKCRKPIISKIHGFALAGGMGLVAASDIALAADDAVFGLPEINIGLVPMIVQRTLERVIGQKALAYYGLSGERFNASEALAYGLISKVFPKAALDKEALALAEKIASAGPETLAVLTESIREAPAFGMSAKLKDSALKIAAFSQSTDSKQGIAGFVSKSKSKP